MYRPARTSTLLTGAAFLSGVIGLIVYCGGYSGWLALLWAVVVVLLVGSAVPVGATGRLRDQLAAHWRATLLAALVVVLPLVPRVANFSLSLTHPDEFALAWFSHQLDFATTNVFGPIPDLPIWDHQMPSLYFVLQKLFFVVVGGTPFDIKLSTMPYVLLTALALYLCTKTVLGVPAAFTSVLIYGFLAPSIYADTFATPITTSMALFLLFFLFSVLNVRRQEFGLAVLAGVVCALCYLGVPTSYLALPLLLAFAVLALFCAPPRRVVRSLGASLLAFLVVLLPYAAGAARSANYFAERITRVAPVVGPLFGIKPPLEEVTRSRSDLPAKWKAHFSYLWKDEVGGCCGFEFGQAALFDPFTLALLILGVVLSLAVKAKRIEFLMVHGVIVACLLGLGFANPPPTITRYAVLFPLFALILAVPVAMVVGWSRIPRFVRAGLATAVLALVVGFNLHHFEAALARDTAGGREDTEDVKVALYLRDHFPGREIRVAAFPGFHLEYALRFFLPGASVATDYHDSYLRSFDTTRGYLYVILLPEEFSPRFQKADPGGKLIAGVSWKYTLFVKPTAR